jgi:N-succinyldiaminopimelate aminotransferase
MQYMAQRVRHFGTTIFTEMTALANEHEAINLGQGFPDFAAPDFIKTAAQAAIAADINQYAPATGRSRLRQAIAHKMASHYGLDINPDQEVLVTHGATEAIFATILGLVDPGDEVIIFEPFYDSYVPAVQMAGGIPRFYTLRPPGWGIDPDRLATLFTPHTKLLILNTPHNPTGKVFSKAELSLIAGLCRQYDVLLLSDEVYEHIIFDGREHILPAALPEMSERTITISSLGKTFSVTGWKVGWAIARPDILSAVFRTHQYMTFSGAAPLQEAAANALETADETGYYPALIRLYQQKRDRLCAALETVGLPVMVPAGTYFVMANISHLDFANDIQFCRYLTTEIGVAAIPPQRLLPPAGRRCRAGPFCFL